MLELFVMIAAMFAILYFLMIRPQKRRMQQHQDTINSLEPGTRVLLSSGIFATISHIGERHAIMELAPGVEVTMAKTSITRVVTEDEEEFELTDEDVLADEDLLVDQDVLVDELPIGEELDLSDPLREADVEFDPRPGTNN